jgi:hypothetical protein
MCDENLRPVKQSRVGRFNPPAEDQHVLTDFAIPMCKRGRSDQRHHRQTQHKQYPKQTYFIHVHLLLNELKGCEELYAGNFTTGFRVS